MKVFVFVLIIILSVSCSPENLWQKAGFAKPEPISISSKTGRADISEDGDKVDVGRDAGLETYLGEVFLSSVEAAVLRDAPRLVAHSVEEALVGDVALRQAVEHFASKGALPAAYADEGHADFKGKVAGVEVALAAPPTTMVSGLQKLKISPRSTSCIMQLNLRTSA